MKIIDGKAHAAALRAELKEKIEKMERKPALAVVIVGEDPASQIYVRNKIKACGELGIRSLSYELPVNSTQEEVECLLDKLAADVDIDGILLQLPLPTAWTRPLVTVATAALEVSHKTPSVTPSVSRTSISPTLVV